MKLRASTSKCDNAVSASVSRCIAPLKHAACALTALRRVRRGGSHQRSLQARVRAVEFGLAVLQQLVQRALVVVQRLRLRQARRELLDTKQPTPNSALCALASCWL